MAVRRNFTSFARSVRDAPRPWCRSRSSSRCGTSPCTASPRPSPASCSSSSRRRRRCVARAWDSRRAEIGSPIWLGQSEASRSKSSTARSRNGTLSLARGLDARRSTGRGARPSGSVARARRRAPWRRRRSTSRRRCDRKRVAERVVSRVPSTHRATVGRRDERRDAGAHPTTPARRPLDRRRDR